MDSFTRSKNIIAACEEYLDSKAGTLKKKDLAKKYEIPYSTLTRWLRRLLSKPSCEEGSVANENDDDFLLQMMRQNITKNC